jgi:hypothetical protein
MGIPCERVPEEEMKMITILELPMNCRTIAAALFLVCSSTLSSCSKHIRAESDPGPHAGKSIRLCCRYNMACLRALDTGSRKANASGDIWHSCGARREGRE